MRADQNLRPGDVVRVNRGSFYGPGADETETVEWVSGNGHTIRTENGPADITRLVLVSRGACTGRFDCRCGHGYHQDDPPPKRGI
jgi:hypothetical protein